MTDQDNFRSIDKMITSVVSPWLCFGAFISTAFDKFCKTRIQCTEKWDQTLKYTKNIISEEQFCKTQAESLKMEKPRCNKQYLDVTLNVCVHTDLHITCPKYGFGHLSIKQHILAITPLSHLRILYICSSGLSSFKFSLFTVLVRA